MSRATCCHRTLHCSNPWLSHSRGCSRLLEHLDSVSERCAGACEHPLLVGREVDVDDRLPSALSVCTLITRTFTDIAGLSESLTAQEDKKLILFAPHAFAPQRQYRPRVPP